MYMVVYNLLTCFLQYEFDTSEARDNPERARKTLMLRNIPNK